MDQNPLPSSLPSADELGISDLEYERILRGMRQWDRVDEVTSAPADRPARRRGRRSTWVRVVLLALVAVAVLNRHGGSGSKPAYAFLTTEAGHPVTYSSCRPVQVAVYPAGGPPDAAQLVRDAVAQLRAATGLDIVIIGVFGGHAPNWNFKAAPIRPGDPISVSWQDGAAIADLTGDVAGLGGSYVVSGPSGLEHLDAGTIALSREFYARGDRGQEMAVLLHEFGHVFGLDHVASKHELMYPSVTGLTSFGPGDLEGLRILGHGPCT